MRVIPFLFSAAAFAAGITGQASATTYTVNQAIGPSGHVTGTIDTDGTIGALTPSDFTAWDLLVAGAGATTVLNETNSAVYIYGDAATATLSSILFDYDASPIGMLLFQAGGFGNGQTYWCNASTLGACFQGASAVPESYYSASQQHESRSGTQVIATAAATAAPEPAVWMTMVAGLGMLGAAMRRKRKVNATMRFA